MTSFKQIEANRRNASKSTGPMTEEGKQRSRCNAVRHGLTAETVIAALEDADDYKAFEAAIITDHKFQSAVEPGLVLGLASLLWRLRRATTMETGLGAVSVSVAATTCRPTVATTIELPDPSVGSTQSSAETAERSKIVIASAWIEQGVLLYRSVVGITARFIARRTSCSLGPFMPPHALSNQIN